MKYTEQQLKTWTKALSPSEEERAEKEYDITPAAIDICRSSYSGYMPADRIEFVETEFLKRLNEAYTLGTVPV